MKSWKKQITIFLLSQGITLFGSSLVQFSIIWYVTLTTSSGIWVSLFTICSFVPQFLISFFSGVWADRYPRKYLIIIADSVIAISTLILALYLPMIRNDRDLLFSLLVISVIRSLGTGIQTPAVNAVIPQLVQEEKLMRFNGINATIQSIVQFAAPAAAGAILTMGTFRSTLFIDVITAILGIGLLSCLVIPKQSYTRENQESSIFIEMKLGFRYTRSNAFIGKILFTYGLFIFLTVPAGFLATLYVSRTFGSDYVYLSIVEVVGFLGMVLGGLLISAWGGFSNRVKTMAVGLFMFGTLAVFMGLSKQFILYLFFMALYGIALTAVQTSVTTIIQEKTEQSMQGRVFGFLGAMYSGFLPVGMAIFGPMADVFPMAGIMILSGALLILLSIIVFVDRKMYNNYGNK